MAIKLEETQQAIAAFSNIIVIFLMLSLAIIFFSNKALVIDKLIYSAAIIAALASFIFLSHRSRHRKLLPVLEEDKKIWLLTSSMCLILGITFFMNDNGLLTALMFFTVLSNPVTFRGFIIVPFISLWFAFFG